MKTKRNTRMIKIRLPNYKCISWNKLYSGRHWSIRAMLAQDAHTQVQYEISKMRVDMFQEMVKIEVIAYLKRTIDPDNVCAKLLIDGLKGKVILDDRSKMVESVTTKCIKSDHDFAEIIISSL